MCDEQRCKSCRRTFPATDEYFYVAWRNASGEPRLGKDCRPCSIAINNAYKRRREQLKALGQWVPSRKSPGMAEPKTRQRRKPGGKPPPPVTVPPGLPRLTTWRGPVPQGYGVAA